MRARASLPAGPSRRRAAARLRVVVHDRRRFPWPRRRRRRAAAQRRRRRASPRLVPPLVPPSTRTTTTTTPLAARASTPRRSSSSRPGPSPWSIRCCPPMDPTRRRSRRSTTARCSSSRARWRSSSRPKSSCASPAARWRGRGTSRRATPASTACGCAAPATVGGSSSTASRTSGEPCAIPRADVGETALAHQRVPDAEAKSTLAATLVATNGGGELTFLWGTDRWTAQLRRRSRHGRGEHREGRSSVSDPGASAAKSEIHHLSATALAAAIRARRISSREALDALAARIDRHDRALNLVVTLDLERARRDAAAADEEVARGKLRGPLHGLPMTIKDSYQTAGLRTTSGAPELARARASRGRRAGGEAARRRRRHLRQDQSADLRRRRAELQRRVRTVEQPLGHDAQPRGVVGRFGGRARGRLHAARARLRHRRLDPQSVALLRGGRSQAVVPLGAGAGADPRSARHADAGRHRGGGTDGAQRRGSRGGARHPRRARTTGRRWAGR